MLGAKEQIADLIAKIVATTNLPPTGRCASATAPRSLLLAGFDPSKPLQRAAACLRLRAFTTLATFLARPAQACRMDADAEPHPGGVLAC